MKSLLATAFSMSDLWKALFQCASPRLPFEEDGRFCEMSNHSFIGFTWEVFRLGMEGSKAQSLPCGEATLKVSRVVEHQVFAR